MRNVRLLTAAALCALSLPLLAADAPAKVLVYTRWKWVKNQQTGAVVDKGAFHHTSTEAAADEISKYFNANGYPCLVTDDPAVFLSDAFKSIKCVVFAVTNHEQFQTDAQREAFYSFVENGGGVVAIHSASANERGSKRWRDFLGGAFERHYVKHQSVPFKHADRSHPAIACLPPDYVWADDEIYLNHPDEKVRPLLTLDWEDVLEESRKTDKNGKPACGGHVLEWCKTYGKGRIFYTALGHNPADFGKMEFQLHLLNAAKWAMGELPDRLAVSADAKIEKVIDGVRLVRNGKEIWRFNLATRENTPFVHPLCLPDGRCVTDARTSDHPWHLGLWFCWKYINGLNYWEPRNPAAGNLFPDGMTVIRDFDIQPSGAACDVKLKLWYGPRNEPGRVLLDEERTVSFSAPDEKGGYRITATHRFTAREKVTFDCRRPIGYGGFSLRMASLMREFTLTGEGGTPDAAKNVAGPKEMTAVTYTCPKTGHGVTVRMLAPLPAERIYTWADHRFANPVPMYAEPLVLEPGGKMELRYEVTVF